MLYVFSIRDLMQNLPQSTIVKTQILQLPLLYECRFLCCAQADLRQNDFFVTGCEHGTVCKYSLKTDSLEEVLTRCTLPIRDIALSPDGNWVAVASEYVLEIQLASTKTN